MIELKHTPGPWTASQGYDGEAKRWVVCSDTGGKAWVVAMVLNGAPGDTLKTEKYTARLIAAAPDLLRELIDFHDHWIDQGEHECDGIPGGCPVQAAIDKATKKPPKCQHG